MRITIVVYSSREDMLSHDRSKKLWEKEIDVKYREEFIKAEREIEETPGVRAIGFFDEKGNSWTYQDIAESLPYNTTPK